MAQSNRFEVNLGGLTLKAEDQRGVATSIQGAVLSYLAQKYSVPVEGVKFINEAGILGMFIPPGDQGKK